MIRDLRYEEIERAEKRSRVIKLGVAIVLASAATTFVLSREQQIHREWTRLPVARQGDLDSLKIRRDAIERLLEQRSFWTGVFKASKERDALVVAIANEERMVEQAAERVEAQQRRQAEEAEASRGRALVHVERGDYERAIQQFERALELAAPDWEHIAQIQVDLAALREWRAEGEEGALSDR